jgi:GT2 family glycosyltransferase/SAM-dependent methyltransferase/glycosyltransferase involved in cell wall biosynthesis
VPWAPDVQVVYEHFHRYLWAAGTVAGRTVLDLGSGEGFGAAILSESAERVVGIDIDERTVEHSRLNYGAPNLQFELGSALDLSAYDDGSFGAVVAFEIIEHVHDHERVLGEITRVLDEDGILIMSTPDRRTYSEVSGQVNPFHERELSLDEFLGLLTSHFPHVASWGQRTIAGSHMNSLGASDDAPRAAEPSDFFIERAGEDWRVAGEPAALYCVALAAKQQLPPTAASSTLADFGLELLRVQERELAVRGSEADQLAVTLERERAEHVRALRQRDASHGDELEQRDRDIERRGQDIYALREDVVARGEVILERDRTIESLLGDMAAAQQANRRTEESVIWQAFQRLRGRMYGAIGGEHSLIARTLGMSLRLIGRIVIKRAPPDAPDPESADLERGEPTPEVISMPEYEHPKVSLIIPIHAHADLTLACLESIRHHTTHVSYEVILVDDAADAETQRLLDRVRGARLIRNEENRGYLRSVNLGASVARGEWLVIFNNDTEVTTGWLRAMLDCAESADDVGVVTPKFVYPDGSLNEAGGIIWRDGTGVNYGRGDSPGEFQYEYRRETDYGSAAALMVKTLLWRDVGGFDERYLPMYYEDVDLCFEARERGLRVLFEPTAVVVHVEGATAGVDAESGPKRHQEENRPKFVAKWRHRLQAEHLPPAPTNIRTAANRHRGPHVLVVDHCVPMWDHDAGSLRMLGIIRAVLDLGARVTFMPDNFAPLQPYTRILQGMGVEVLYGQLDVNAELATIGPTLTAAILSRPHPASRWLDSVREFAPTAKIAYDTVDLHWLRETRRDFLGGQSAGAGSANSADGNLDVESIPPKAKALRELELAMVRAADVTMVVSESEAAQLAKDVPSAQLLLVPTVHEIDPFVLPPEGRAGILFLGSFKHPPNIDAVLRLVKDVMPEVWSDLPDVRLTIVGSNPPAEVRALASPRVDVAGWIEDLRPLLDRSRMLVAPLRYGAGLNGKITQCLASGLPVVTTPIGAEGIDELDRSTLVAEDVTELAAHVVRLYDDDVLWCELSHAGQDLVDRHCAPTVISERFTQLLEGVGLSRADAPDTVVGSAGSP